MFTVRLFVHPKAAIQAGKATFGVLPLGITDNDIKNLSQAIRDELAEAVLTNDIVGKREDDLQTGEATLGELFRLLAHRVELRIAAQIATRDAQEKERVETLRQQEEDVTKRRDAEAKAAKRILSIQKWVGQKGSVSQKKRLAEGVLPVEEVLEDITSHLCEDLSIDSRERYTRIVGDDACVCACSDLVEFDVQPATALTEEQYELLLDAREEASTAVALVHRAKCPQCDCPGVERLSIQVEMQWDGIDVVREYAI